MIDFSKPVRTCRGDVGRVICTNCKRHDGKSIIVLFVSSSGEEYVEFHRAEDLVQYIPRKRIIFEETGEVRQAKNGEGIMSDGEFQVWLSQSSECKYPIFTRREEEF